MAKPGKAEVRDHWEEETAGTRYGSDESGDEFYRQVEEARYRLEPFIPAFAEFDTWSGKEILEVGVGAGSDFSRFVKGGANATGIDLTNAAVNHTARNLRRLGYRDDAYRLVQGDAENLPFPDDTFDLVYSWGVLHHSPDTVEAFRQALRVLKPGGRLKVMVYHVYSWTASLLWVRHALLRGKPWAGPRKVVFEHLESPGTKAYSRSQIRQLVENTGFADVRVWTRLGPGDVLDVKPSAKYSGPIYRAVWALYPRRLVRMSGDRFGLYLLITARKP